MPDHRSRDAGGRLQGPLPRLPLVDRLAVSAASSPTLTQACGPPTYAPRTDGGAPRCQRGSRYARPIDMFTHEVNTFVKTDGLPVARSGEPTRHRREERGGREPPPSRILEDSDLPWSLSSGTPAAMARCGLPATRRSFPPIRRAPVPWGDRSSSRCRMDSGFRSVDGEIASSSPKSTWPLRRILPFLAVPKDRDYDNLVPRTGDAVSPTSVMRASGAWP